MGLLSEGKPLSFNDAIEHLNYIRQHGIVQFLNTWNRVKDVKDDELRWGDEIELGIFVVDPILKTIKISLRGVELREFLVQRENEMDHQTEGCVWQPEFGKWMIESTPNRPYSNYASDLLRVERNMLLRRRRLLSCLQENEIAPTVTGYPLMGVGDFINPAGEFEAPYSESQFIPDVVLNPHPRFGSLVRNIKARRGGKVQIKVPLFHDLLTPEFNRIEGSTQTLSNGMPLESDTNINMDCMAFGMGMCSLQVTLQARDICESRYMYDQLAVLAPIMLAMTAASPIFKGRLGDIDVRWSVISQSVDDRTPAERGEIPDDLLTAAANEGFVNKGIERQYKSRYDSISTYLYHCSQSKDCERTFEIYNDVPCPIDVDAKQLLRAAGVDENLAHHLAHIFSRDPLVVFEDHIELDDTQTTDHFESIQSTNWQTVRWKPPPPRHPNSPYIGWRTEFRSMETQLTDFENAAFTVFIALVTRIILAFDLNLYIPLSKVDENMKRAHQRDAVNTQKFFFREYMAPPEFHDLYTDRAARNWRESYGSEPCKLKSQQQWCNFLSPEDAFEEMTITQILNGKDSYFPGLIPLVYAYLDYIDCDTETFNRVDQYMKFISARATGKLMTPATWMRKFVSGHPSYKQDSVISEDIAYDLMMACKNIGEGNRECPELLGAVSIHRVRAEDAYGSVLAGQLSTAERSELISAYIQRAETLRQSKRRSGSNYAAAATNSPSARTTPTPAVPFERSRSVNSAY